ncbi:MAG: hypothetical protein FWE42_04900 [Defluviitaleaceae bacterium]|nr:hypothetical protein [Defluviitaleaceae bacterium]
MERYIKKWLLAIITLLLVIGIVITVWIFTQHSPQQEFHGIFLFINIISEWRHYP